MIEKMTKTTVTLEELHNALTKHKIEINNFSSCVWTALTGVDLIVITQSPSEYRRGTATIIAREETLKAIFA